MEKKKILYVGGFLLPDKNAAAHRVVNIAKALDTEGYEVIFACLKDKNLDTLEEQSYFGFRCYYYNCRNDLDYRLGSKPLKKIIDDIKPDIIISYNYPSVALLKIMKYCRKNRVKCIADATEWDLTQEKSIKGFLKNLDSNIRMAFIHRHIDGVIAISKYLYNYYSSYTNTILIPPLVDIDDEKWKTDRKKIDDGITRIIYAGSPNVQKERLDLIIDAIREAQKSYQIQMIVIGLNKADFIRNFKYKEEIGEWVVFKGRLSHKDSIKEVSRANWSIVIRDKSKKVEAGFPTKVVESITCKTPVIANRFSNISDYLDENNSILISDKEHIIEAINKACERDDSNFDNSIFDFRNYSNRLHIFLDLIANQ